MQLTVRARFRSKLLDTSDIMETLSSADLALSQWINVFLVERAAMLQWTVVKSTKYDLHYVCK